MEKSDTTKDPAFLEYVYELNEGNDLTSAFDLSLKAIDNLDVAQLNRIGLKTYEKDKWTIHKILQHLIDWERICLCLNETLLIRKSRNCTPQAMT